MTTSHVGARVAPQEISRRERKKDATRERIAHVALELFAERGFDATTVGDIAERADVAKGTFFNYYPRKEAVLDALAERTATEMEGVTRRLLAGRGKSRRKVATFVHEISRRHSHNPGLARVFLTRLLTGHHDPADGFPTRIRGLMRGLIEQGQSTGEFRRDVDPGRASAVIQSAALGTLLVWFSRETPPFDLERELQERIGLVLDGLTGRRGGTP